MVYVFLAPGFEEGEAIVPIDLMLRAGISVTTVGIGSLVIPGAHGISVTADITESQLASLPEDAEMILLPGGMPGTKNLDASPFVHACIQSATERNLPLAAICAAPSVYGKLGLLPQAHEFAIGKELDISQRRMFAEVRRIGGKNRVHDISLSYTLVLRKKTSW